MLQDSLDWKRFPEHKFSTYLELEHGTSDVGSTQWPIVACITIGAVNLVIVNPT